MKNDYKTKMALDSWNARQVELKELRGEKD